MMYLIGREEEERQTPEIGINVAVEVLVEHTMMKSLMQMRLRRRWRVQTLYIYSEAGKFPYQFRQPTSWSR